MNSKALPNFLIVGVARCGTTSLYHYLKQHPEIGFPKKKEPKYFSSLHLDFPQKGIGDHTVDEKIIKNFREYQRLFAGLENYSVIGEASSDYFYYHEKTIPEIKKTLGDVPILISIRNPLDRCYSAYNNLVRDNREPLSFERALKEEEERVKKGWDWMWAYKKGSLYADGIAAFQENFSKVKVVLFEDLQKDPKQVLREIENFLSLKPYEKYDVSIKYSPSGNPKNKFIKLISSRNSMCINRMRTTAMSLIPRKYLEKVSAGFFSKDQIDGKTMDYLENYFAEDIRKTGEIIGNSLHVWKK
ncbi:MAG TPA: sulfotransferase [Aequorivita sp.]|nr:sulfotransferase [Aequorivita sp.]